MNIETRVANLEKIHPPGQNIFITSMPTETVEESIRAYEAKHNVKFDHNDPTNKIWDVVFFGKEYDANSNPIS
jgi:hypothetical protein